VVNMVLNDLIDELEKAEPIGGLACSILHDVVDKAVSLHEWERRGRPFGAVFIHGGLMIPSLFLSVGEARSYYGGGRSA